MGFILFWGPFSTSQAQNRAPEWRWRQILSIPAIGGKLRAITVDPKNPDKIYVGTDSGMILRSINGGVTWLEINIEPRVVDRGNTGLVVPKLPRLGATTRTNFGTAVDPPFRRTVDRLETDGAAFFFPIRPRFFWAGFYIVLPDASPDLLTPTTLNREWETQPVRRIALCPGAYYSLIVATSDAVYGSTDDGLTYVRLFANAGRVFISNLICSEDNPKLIAVATDIGLFTSNDGGHSFDQDLTAWPGQKSTAVAYGPPVGGKEPPLFSAAGSELFAGTQSGGLDNIYPTDPSTAPWLSIRWIDSSPKGHIYLATDDGARVSYDRGKTWKTLARTLLSRQAIKQVEVGFNEWGGERVALMLNQIVRSSKGKAVSGLQDSMVYSSDDGGQTWHPFFHGLALRTYQQMASVPAINGNPPGWWVATSGEVWTTYPRKRSSEYDREASAWAKKRRLATPDIGLTIMSVLRKSQLSNQALADLGERRRFRTLVPQVDFYFAYYNAPTVGNQDDVLGRGGLAINTQARWEPASFIGLVQLNWRFATLLDPYNALVGYRRRLHTLRRRVEYSTSDAWVERMNLLLELERGLEDPYQVESLKARIHSLEAILNVWLEEPLPYSEVFTGESP